MCVLIMLQLTSSCQADLRGQRCRVEAYIFLKGIKARSRGNSRTMAVMAVMATGEIPALDDNHENVTTTVCVTRVKLPALQYFLEHMFLLFQKTFLRKLDC